MLHFSSKLLVNSLHIAIYIYNIIYIYILKIYIKEVNKKKSIFCPYSNFGTRKSNATILNNAKYNATTKVCLYNYYYNYTLFSLLIHMVIINYHYYDYEV